MASQRKIDNYKKGINSIMSYLMDRTKVHFEVEDYDGYVDEMPFFSLHIYLKKTVYEHLIDMVLENPKKYMDSSLSEEMAQAGVSVEWLKKEIGYKRKITSFVLKEKFSFIDLETYHKYVSALELFLMFTSFRNVVYHLYGMTIFPFESTMEDIQKKIEEETKYFLQYESIEGLWSDWVKEVDWENMIEDDDEEQKPKKGFWESFWENLIEKHPELLEDEETKREMEEDIKREKEEELAEKKEPYGVLNLCEKAKDSLWFEDIEGDLGLDMIYIPTLTDIMCKVFWKTKYSTALNRYNKEYVQDIERKLKSGQKTGIPEIDAGIYEVEIEERSSLFNRSAMLPYVTDKREEQLAIYKTFLDRVLEVLQSPLFKLSSDFTYEVIRETYEGMYSLYFHFRANELTRGSTKVCSREDMLNVSGRKRDAFFDRIQPYSQSFTSEEIERFEEQLNLSFEHRIED